MNTKNKSVKLSMRSVVKMLGWMVAGAVLGYLGSYFMMNSDILSSTAGSFLAAFQSAVLPIAAGITVIAVISGEVILKKLHEIGDKILHAEDEVCDELEFQEEKIGALGMNLCTVMQIAVFLILALGGPVNPADGAAVRFLLAVAVLLGCCIYEAFWQLRYVKSVQYIRPEFSEADPSSMKFQEQWLSCCDEAEREMIFYSSYRTYIRMSRLMPMVLAVVLITNMIYGTGIMAVLAVAALWLVSTVTYTHSCVNMRKKRARGIR